jgi:hypothetical protein
MNVVLDIPDEIANRFETRREIERRALAALALDEFQLGRMTRPQLRRLLGFETRGELDAFLAERGIFETYTAEDLERDRADLQRAGF